MEAAVSLAPLSSLEAEVPGLVQLLREGHYARALDGACILLKDFPQARDLLLMAAQCLRQLARLDEALAILDRLEQFHPRFSQLHQERGLCHLARKDASRAIAALTQAVDMNPSLPASWRHLRALYEAAGDAAKAQEATRHIATLRGFPPEVVSAASLQADGEPVIAEDIIRTHLRRQGQHPEAVRLLGKIAMERGLLDEAERQFKIVLATVPDHRGARFDYTIVLAHQHKYREADVQARQLLALEPANRYYGLLAAVAATGLGDQERSSALCQSLLVSKPDSPEMCLWLGHTLRNLGRTQDAIDVYRAAGKSQPDFGNACWSLANLKTYQFSDAEIAQMRAMEKVPKATSGDRSYLCFALGKALEDQGAFAEAWTYYARGNALKRQQSRYERERTEADIAQQAAICTRDFFRQRAGWGDRRPDPIFILGLPRSGSTLLEQILASHSRVEGTQELADIQTMVVELAGNESDPDMSRYPAVLAHMTRGDFHALGERYLAETRVYRTDKPFFIDKMPNNFRHVGLIHLMLPNAKIIDARREPMACCFSNFKQLFGYGQYFSYSFDDIGHYYRSYLELMRHWDEALPGRVLHVQHEDVVDDLEGSVRRILDYCGLEFEQTCVEFHKTRRNVRTPSSEQVRQPIFRDSLDQWKNFEPWLEPLKEALGDALVNYRS